MKRTKKQLVEDMKTCVFLYLAQEQEKRRTGLLTALNDAVCSSLMPEIDSEIKRVKELINKYYEAVEYDIQLNREAKEVKLR